jgi:hypothetical protein
VVVDNAATTGITITGTWSALTAPVGFFGSNFLLDGTSGKGTKSVRFTPNLPVSGSYSVYARWIAAPDRATNAPFDIKGSSGTRTVLKNQRLQGNQWVLLGTYNFAAGTTGSVLLRNVADGLVIADAVRFVKQ